ncbi:hypothetical protein PM10SUCC1_04720 [Propionigenium maris DSM 9537]|uniref:Uncharacterized protein n=1 Tax=Propionigenium maris DSM 9537 TaxID=1123000 RepID=A0A9W6GJU4_9FUSO|nr:hypothetical protein [Propionigenium maris]GLI54957.1 hypothetical protein PM10SUCC1_04720 [Propionigenium maris DSM 9537]
MKIIIPGGETLEIDHIVSDYNGTIALDGRLIEGVAELMGKLAEEVTIHVITADTFGSVERELQGVPVSYTRSAQRSRTGLRQSM